MMGQPEGRVEGDGLHEQDVARLDAVVLGRQLGQLPAMIRGRFGEVAEEAGVVVEGVVVVEEGELASRAGTAGQRRQGEAGGAREQVAGHGTYSRPGARRNLVDVIDGAGRAA